MHSAIMGRIIAIVWSIFNMPLPWDAYNWSLLQFVVTMIFIYLCAQFVFQILGNWIKFRGGEANDDEPDESV